jgi:hypothetical protein
MQVRKQVFYNFQTYQMKQLINIQSDLKVPKGQFNSFGKYYYRNAEEILEALKPLLKKYECVLKLSDEIKEVGSVIFIETTATLLFPDFKDGIKVTAQAGVDLNAKGMSQAQCFGASSSYARKYALSGLFLLDDSKDADATNTHGKEDLTDYKSKLIIKCQDITDAMKRASAQRSINDAGAMADLIKIEKRINELTN